MSATNSSNLRKPRTQNLQPLLLNLWLEKKHKGKVMA